jgi:hypothetical protein
VGMSSDQSPDEVTAAEWPIGSPIDRFYAEGEPEPVAVPDLTANAVVAQLVDLLIRRQAAAAVDLALDELDETLTALARLRAQLAEIAGQWRAP